MLFKEKKKANWWLLNSEFLAKSGFDDLYYLTRLCETLNEFLKDSPIPVLTTYDKNHHRIYFTIGKLQSWFTVDTDVSYFDYIKKVKRWMMNYFPQYVVEIEDEVDLTENDVLEEIKKGIDLNSLALKKKKILIKEKGVITRIILKQDKFEFIKNGNKSIRMCGDINNVIPLSVFLKTIREMKENKKSDEQIREYIFKNSEEVERIEESKKKILIDYSPKMMKNFFITRFPDFKNVSLKKDINGLYTWGDKYILKFETDSSREDCLQYLRDRRKEKGIVMDIEND